MHLLVEDCRGIGLPRRHREAPGLGQPRLHGLDQVAQDRCWLKHDVTRPQARHRRTASLEARPSLDDVLPEQHVVVRRARVAHTARLPGEGEHEPLPVHVDGPATRHAVATRRLPAVGATGRGTVATHPPGHKRRLEVEALPQLVRAVRPGLVADKPNTPFDEHHPAHEHLQGVVAHDRTLPEVNVPVVAHVGLEREAEAGISPAAFGLAHGSAIEHGGVMGRDALEARPVGRVLAIGVAARVGQDEPAVPHGAELQVIGMAVAAPQGPIEKDRLVGVPVPRAPGHEEPAVLAIERPRQLVGARNSERMVRILRLAAIFREVGGIELDRASPSLERGVPQHGSRERKHAGDAASIGVSLGVDRPIGQALGK